MAMRVDGNVNETWGGLRDGLLEVADEVCERTKATSDIARFGDGILRLAKSLRRRADCSRFTRFQRRVWTRQRLL